MDFLAQPVIGAIRMEAVIFGAMAVLSVGSAVGMVFMARSPVHAALLLVLNFVALAVFYVLLDAHFLAAVQIIVYAGAIMVLFLFVIMLLGVDRAESLEEPVRFLRPVGYAFGLALFGILAWTIRTALTDTPFRSLAQANRSGNTQEVGRLLFTKYLFPFEVTSILLIVAAIGAMILGRRHAPGEPGVEADEDAAPPMEPAAPLPVAGAQEDQP